MNPPPAHPSRHAFTLIEMAAAITVLGIIGAVLLPVVESSADAFGSAAQLREQSVAAGFAMERVARELRAVPLGAAPGTAGIASASGAMFTTTAGTGIEWSGDTLWLRADAVTRYPLAREVSAFELTFLADDGLTDVLATPALTQRVYVSLTVGEVELSQAVFLRARTIDP